MDNFGTGVSRVLDPSLTAFLMAVWQQGKPPCDAELNLAEQLAAQWDQTINLRGCPSGWLGNETNPRVDFQTDPTWSNWFKFGRQRTGETKAITWASVNGWLIPVLATRTGAPPGTPNNTDTWNLIALDPPPANAGDYRVDFVFLEVWKARVAPNPSTTNKPGAAYIYRHGNVEGGMAFVADDIKDPAMGFETTQRVQLQHRIRVVTGLVGLSSYPDGFDPAVVKAKGAYLPSDPTAVTSYTFTNMRQELGDPGLWRAGDGTANSLGSVDGYVYAIPIGVVFRRNSVPWNGEPSQNLNGGINRNPTAVDRTGVKTFSNTPLVNTIGGIDDTVLSFALSTSTNIPLPAAPVTALLIRVGDELMRYTAISGTTITISERGALGTRAEAHPQGTPVTIESSRPDGLYADQVAVTDILDLRHLVNPNGFDYQALLRANLDKLLRGGMHGTWKYTGAGPQGTYVPYQDVVGTAATLGVTKLDAADNIRQVFSDAATVQRVEAVVKGNNDPVPGADINVSWTLDINVKHQVRTTGSLISANDVLYIPVSQFKVGIPGADQDQIRFVNDGTPYAVSLRIDGEPAPLPSSVYTVTPASPTQSDDLVITLGANFPTTDRQVYITLHVLYGPGRGLSRRPHSLQSITYYNPGPDTMVQQEAQPTLNVPLRVAWAPTWVKYNGNEYLGNLPTTAEAYADLGSKTVILSPFRRIVMPSEFRPMDGNSLWYQGPPVLTGTNGATAAPPNWTTIFQDMTVNFGVAGVLAGDRIVFNDTDGIQRSYAIQVVGVNTLTLDRKAGPNPGLISYSIYRGEGLMPTLTVGGAAKWTLTDPLDLFSGTMETNAAHKNIFIELPRHLVPTWGEVWTPIQHPNPDTGSFNEGVNFLVMSKKGVGRPNSEANYVPYVNSTWSSEFFTTWDLNLPEGPAAYNTYYLISGQPFAGMRKFTDTRGRGRKGLELPPFYGVARLYAVYEAQDYKLNGSAYNASTREALGSGATNLLRQNLDGPTFWIELDADGDSTFILNADAIDATKCPNPITFDTGEFIIEASVFGFDRGTFDPAGQARLVLTRGRGQLTDLVTRINNVGWGTPQLDGPTCVIPAPPAQADKILVNYSRTPYQGDAWGSQSNNIDVGYTPGPLTTGVAWQLVSLEVDENTVTSPYDTPKQLEVLASVGFVTTLGTGRLGGDVLSVLATDPSNPGGEDAASFPPTGPGAPRPRINSAVLAVGGGVATEFLGCTAELPLGALFRDKDFRGELVAPTGDLAAPFVYLGSGSAASWYGGATRASGLEQREILLGNASTASGEPGEVLVHCDGNDGNYGILTNFRTFRGGSVFRGNGTRPGGEFAQTLGKVVATPGSTALAGRAMLVRNHVTALGTEVSAGDELMMLIVTTANRQDTSDLVKLVCGTSGSGEGLSAADVYRIEGHPLTRDNAMVEVAPDAVTLARKIDLEV